MTSSFDSDAKHLVDHIKSLSLFMFMALKGLDDFS